MVQLESKNQPQQPMTQQPMSEEQLAELQERIKNMSPEELREFQKKQCIFCHIVAGKVQSKKIFEDDSCLGILDINPANPGHVLLLPKEHYAIMPQLPEDLLQHLFKAAKAISNAVLRSLEANGTNIFVANGPAAGQRAQHFMLHIIPRKDDDGLAFSIPQKKRPEKELEKAQQALAKHLGKEIPKKKAEEKLKETPIVQPIVPEIMPKLPEKKTAVKSKAHKQVKKEAPMETKKQAKGANLDDIAGLFS